MATIDDKARDLVRTLLPPDLVKLLQRVELATTADGRPRVDRAFGVLAIEAMPVYAGDQVQAPPGSGYDSVNDALGAVGPAYVPGGTDVAIVDGGTGASTAAGALANLGAAPVASPAFTGTVTAVDLATTGNATLGNGDADVQTVQGHDRHKGAAPSISVGSALGSGGSVGASLVGTDQVGTLTLVAGTTGLGSGSAATFTFASARPDTNYTVVLFAANATAGANTWQPRIGTKGTTTFNLAIGVAPGAGSSSVWEYLIREWTH